MCNPKRTPSLRPACRRLLLLKRVTGAVLLYLLLLVAQLLQVPQTQQLHLLLLLLLPLLALQILVT